MNSYLNTYLKWIHYTYLSAHFYLHGFLYGDVVILFLLFLFNIGTENVLKCIYSIINFQFKSNCCSKIIISLTYFIINYLINVLIIIITSFEHNVQWCIEGICRVTDNVPLFFKSLTVKPQLVYFQTENVL